jgi:enoyl-CoA hydratase/carnithine racemase
MNQSTAEADVVRFERRDAQAWLTIDRPEKRNALTAGVLAGLRAGVERALGESGVRAIVLTGAGDKAFCAGADLQLAATEMRPDPTRLTTAYADLLRACMECPLPLVARINGHCLAGGMGLLAVCDLAVAADHALFGLPEVKVGLFPMQVLSVLRRLLSERTLAELCLTGEPLDARAARDAGLVNYVAPQGELDAKLEWLVARLVDKSPTAQRRGKYALRTIAGMTWQQALPYLETQIATLSQSADAQEGREAFIARRAPQWTGR